jgi:tRNA1Val (adenine37-N6)-methyltransferase
LRENLFAGEPPVAYKLFVGRLSRQKFLEEGLGDNLFSKRFLPEIKSFPPITQYLNNNLSIIRVNSKSLMKVDLAPDETLDTLEIGGIKIIQKKDGYRYSIDAFLLADFVLRHLRGSIAELGTGSGIIAHILALKQEIEEIVAVEVQEEFYRRAIRSLELNPTTAPKIQLLLADIKSLPKRYPASSFDGIVCNPPYRKVGSGRINPKDEKAIARHEIKINLADILKTSRYLLKNKGKLCMIYPADRLPDLIDQLRAHSLEPKLLRFIHSRCSDPAQLLLFLATLSGKKELQVENPLVVYAPDGGYTDEVQAIYLGGFLQPSDKKKNPV